MEYKKKQINDCELTHFKLIGSQIFMKNEDYVYKVIDNIKKDSINRLQVIADFDWTLSSFEHDVKLKNPTSFEVLHHSVLVTQEMRQKAEEYKDYYIKIIYSDTVSTKEKGDTLKEWWQKYNDIISDTKINQKHIKEIVKQANAKFRQNADEFFNLLNENCIPLSIVSAGIGDIIEEMFIQNRSLDFKANKNEYIKIIANFMNFEGDKMFNLEHKMIHMYNKSDAILYDKDHLEVINERSNVIILGDSEGDHDMADNLKNVKNVLKIGFLNEIDDEKLAKHLKLFDIVLVQDPTLDIPNKILRYILNITK